MEMGDYRGIPYAGHPNKVSPATSDNSNVTAGAWSREDLSDIDDADDIGTADIEDDTGTAERFVNDLSCPRVRGVKAAPEPKSKPGNSELPDSEINNVIRPPGSGQQKAMAMGYSADELRKNDNLDDETLAEVLGLAMDRRAMELLFAVAEASRMGLPSSTESQLNDAVAVPLTSVVSNGLRAGPEGPGLEPAQAMVAKWMSKSSRYRTHFVKESVAPTVASAMPGWKPAKHEKEMRLPMMGDTVRLTQLVANVVEQEVSRGKFPDIHEDEWCLNWLKARGEVALPEEDAHRIKRSARRHRWDEATDEVYMITYGGKELVTSPDSPEGNGITGRVVRTIKFCFKKLALDKGLDYVWDELLWSLVLFAQEATPSLNFEVEEEETLAEDLLRRVRIVKKLMVHAGCSLEVAQHRDTLL
ncbi:hypothetical protein CYMTET_14861 [Cymbomonas tetramitiformis]|uniref:Uncharacterized protein n=1 Tax=Cymbomonas tetramitiformis TaxID=36881 RepID=A0AAE0GFR6_9CHLO|nr:hypothetical protein CYMTET_14861 [Cymbomonas tetramitiformis]